VPYVSCSPKCDTEINFGDDASWTTLQVPQEACTSVGAAAACPALNITSPQTLASGTVGTAYSYQLQTTGGQAPIVYSIATGSLPPGLSMSQAGLLSGTPTTGVKPGQFYWYRVVALDKKGNRSDLSSPVVVRVGSPTIPIPKKPEVKFLKEPFQRVELKFERPTKGLFITVQHRTEGKDPWLTITRALTIDYAIHTSLPEKGKVQYRLIYQAANGVQGEPSEPVEISIVEISIP